MFSIFSRRSIVSSVSAVIKFIKKKKKKKKKHHRFFLENFRLSLEIYGNLRTFSRNARKRSSGFRTTFEDSSEIFGKCLEIFGKLSKTSSLVCLYNKQKYYMPACG